MVIYVYVCAHSHHQWATLLRTWTLHFHVWRFKICNQMITKICTYTKNNSIIVAGLVAKMTENIHINEIYMSLRLCQCFHSLSLYKLSLFSIHDFTMNSSVCCTSRSNWLNRINSKCLIAHNFNAIHSYLPLFSVCVCVVEINSIKWKMIF